MRILKEDLQRIMDAISGNYVELDNVVQIAELGFDKAQEEKIGLFSNQLRLNSVSVGEDCVLTEEEIKFYR